MIRYKGRSQHTVKLLNKPIPQGFKIWALGDYGYIYTWLWHSKKLDPEGVSTRKTPEDLAKTQALVQELFKQLPGKNSYIKESQSKSYLGFYSG